MLNWNEISLEMKEFRHWFIGQGIGGFLMGIRWDFWGGMGWLNGGEEGFWGFLKG